MHTYTQIIQEFTHNVYTNTYIHITKHTYRHVCVCISVDIEKNMHTHIYT